MEKENLKKMNNLENFWNTCDTNFAHITLERHLTGYENIVKYWENMFISKINFSNKKVLEYGIGGAYLGKYLFDNKNIKKYYGVDISKRSIFAANTILSEHFGKFELYLTDYYYNTFNTFCDIFISQACIQHFPNLKYLKVFLSKLEKLKCSELMLQIRHSSTTKFVDDSIKEYSEKDIVFACVTNKETISKYLPSYDLTYFSNIHEVSNYQFLHFKLK